MNYLTFNSSTLLLRRQRLSECGELSKWVFVSRDALLLPRWCFWQEALVVLRSPVAPLCAPLPVCERICGHTHTHSCSHCFLSVCFTGELLTSGLILMFHLMFSRRIELGSERQRQRWWWRELRQRDRRDEDWRTTVSFWTHTSTFLPPPLTPDAVLFKSERTKNVSLWRTGTFVLTSWRLSRGNVLIWENFSSTQLFTFEK